MIIVAYIRDNASEMEQKELEKNTKSGNQINAMPLAYSVERIQPDVILQCRQIELPKRTIFDNFVDCYSVRKNFKMLINVEKSSNAVPVVDGLR